MKVTPLGDRILVKRVEAKEGKVISVGSGRVLDDGSRSEMQLKAGDRIIFSSYAGNEITIDGEEYLIMNEEDVLAKVAK